MRVDPHGAPWTARRPTCRWRTVPAVVCPYCGGLLQAYMLFRPSYPTCQPRKSSFPARNWGGLLYEIRTSRRLLAEPLRGNFQHIDRHPTTVYRIPEMLRSLTYPPKGASAIQSPGPCAARSGAFSLTEITGGGSSTVRDQILRRCLRCRMVSWPKPGLWLANHWDHRPGPETSNLKSSDPRGRHEWRLVPDQFRHCRDSGDGVWFGHPGR